MAMPGHPEREGSADLTNVPALRRLGQGAPLLAGYRDQPRSRRSKTQDPRHGSGLAPNRSATIACGFLFHAIGVSRDRSRSRLIGCQRVVRRASLPLVSLGRHKNLSLEREVDLTLSLRLSKGSTSALSLQFEVSPQTKALSDAGSLAFIGFKLKPLGGSRKPRRLRSCRLPLQRCRATRWFG
jgi:hypothetical protein